MFDMHCHMLPGVDDGARSVNMALRMLRQEMEEGVTGIFLTPHCQPERWPYDPEALRRQADLLRQEARKMLQQGSPEMSEEMPKVGDPVVEIYLGTEVRWCPSVPDWLAEGRCLTMADTDYVLVEFSVQDTLTRIEKALYTLLSLGYRPIIAHVERYECLRGEVRRLERWVDDGVRIQCNASALSRADGMRISRFVHRLMKRGLIHLVGTDAHTDQWRKPELQACLAGLEKKYGADMVQELMEDNPRALLRGEL